MFLFPQLRGTLKLLFEYAFNINLSPPPRQARPPVRGGPEAPRPLLTLPDLDRVRGWDDMSPEEVQYELLLERHFSKDLLAAAVHRPVWTETDEDLLIDKALTEALTEALTAEEVPDDNTHRGVARPPMISPGVMKSLLEFDYTNGWTGPLTKIQAVSNASPDTFSWTASAPTVRSGGSRN